MSYEQDAIDAMLKASNCNECFNLNLGIERATCNTPQPRWIGENYYSADLRIVVVLINPGGGGTESNPGLKAEAALFRQFFESGNYELIRKYFKDSISDGERWLKWYRKVFCLDHNEIAQINIAWCATKENRYPRKMLNNCFKKHSINLIKALDPDIVLLSGSSTHMYAKQIKAEFTSPPIIIKTLHYAHRKSSQEENKEALRVKCLIY